MFKFLFKLFGICPKPKQEKKVEPKLEYMQWPVSNVTLVHPVGLPSDVALLGLCNMPTDVPVNNQYEEDGTKIPDPVGICLAMVQFQVWSENEKLAEESALPHNGVVRCVFGSKRLESTLEEVGQGFHPNSHSCLPTFL